MCGRFTIRTPLAALAARFLVDDLGVGLGPGDDAGPEAAGAGLRPRWNVAPTQPVPVLRSGPAPGADGPARRRLDLLRWGLVPSWARDPGDRAVGARLINARGETAHARPAFRDAFARRRCAVLADGFYEWRRDGRRREPFHFRRPDGAPVAFAGLWARWRPPGADGPPLETCAVVTTHANAVVADVHDRMPVLLDDDGLARWLDPALGEDPAPLRALLVPCPSIDLVAVPVSGWVNDVHHDDPRCLDPPGTAPPPPGRRARRGGPPAPDPPEQRLLFPGL